MVVAGAEVGVAHELAALAADDERHLRVRLVPDHAVDDVGAGFLRGAPPS
jgi:hypothetical protein